MDNAIRPIPKFDSEPEGRAFWESPENDSTEYLDWSETRKTVFPNLKPTTQAISLRLAAGLREAIKIEVNKRDIPYQPA